MRRNDKPIRLFIRATTTGMPRGKSRPVWGERFQDFPADKAYWQLIDASTAFRKQVRLRVFSEWGANFPPAVPVICQN
jgi:hypothetical protein